MENIKELGKIIITFGVLLDDNGNEHVNKPLVYKIDSEGDRIPVNTAISASMYITEHFINVISKHNEDSIQLDETQAISQEKTNVTKRNNTKSNTNG